MPNIYITSPSNALFLGQKIPITIGRNGFCLPSNKQEGDGKTPLINLKPMALFYRADKVRRIKTWLPTFPIYHNDGWCDAQNDALYNQFVSLPFRASAENLWRSDRRYDYIIVTDYNYPDAVGNKGSAIFIHIMHEDSTPTAGCIGFRQHHLKRIISSLQPNDHFILTRCDVV